MRCGGQLPPAPGGAATTATRDVRGELRQLLLPGITALTQADASALRDVAATFATDVRAYLELSDGDADADRRALREQARGRLHDTTLQLLEYLASDAYGQGIARPRANSLVRELDADAHRIIRAVGAPADGDLLGGLRAATRDARRLGSTDIRLEASPLRTPVPPGRADDLVGATREALNNVVKHSGATAAVVRCEELAGTITVTVTDDGSGLPPGRRRGGFGLRNSIRERVRRSGGRVTVGRSDSGGVRVTMRLDERGSR